jgi:hypothetical protein
MRVAFVLTQDRGGPVDLTVALARELARRPGGPTVMIAGPEPSTSAGDVAGLLKPIRVGSKTDVRGGRELGRILRRWAPDVVHAQDRRAALVATTVAWVGAPVAATYHGVPDGAAGLWVTAGPLAGRRPTAGSAAVLTADALVARRVAVTVAPSAAMAGFLRRRLRVPAAKLRVIPNGVALPPPRPPVGPDRGDGRRPGLRRLAGWRGVRTAGQRKWLAGPACRRAHLGRCDGVAGFRPQPGRNTGPGGGSRGAALLD